MRFFALLRFLWPYSSVNSVFHLNFINTPCTHSVRRGCTFEHFSQMHSDGFSSIAYAMLATTICFPSSPVHTHTCSACNDFQQPFQLIHYSNSNRIWRDLCEKRFGICVCFKCKQELHVCKHIRSISLDHRHRHRIHLECTLGLGGQNRFKWCVR